jgi:single-stranded DNA-binding protein
MDSPYVDEDGCSLTFSLNAAILIGRVSKYGLTLKNGIAVGALELVEKGRDEKLHTSYVNILIWGKAGAPQASVVPPGSLVLVSGQIRPKKGKNEWTLMVAAKEMTLLDDAPEGEYATREAV